MWNLNHFCYASTNNAWLHDRLMLCHCPHWHYRGSYLMMAVSLKGTLYLGLGRMLYMPVQKTQYPSLMMLWVQLVKALQLHMNICGYLGGQSEAAAAWTFKLQWHHQYDVLVFHPCLLSLRAQCTGLKGICFPQVLNSMSVEEKGTEIAMSANLPMWIWGFKFQMHSTPILPYSTVQMV